MQKSDVKSELNLLEKLYADVIGMIDLEELNNEIKKLDQLTYDQGFWDNTNSAQKVVKELTVLKNKQKSITDYIELFDEIKLLSEFLLMGEDMDDEFISQVDKFKDDTESLSVDLLLNDPNDKLYAVLEIHPGAGGTESQDWAEMLYRMYKRFAENKGFEFELLDYQNGDEAGIKSVTFCLRGPNSFGYLKTENGVHRLVRISPFDSGGRRHTSFASVSVYPEIDDTVSIDMNEKDLKIDTYRSSGAGGQSVNTTDSAVRITHLPTKTVVTVQNERSQIKNRDKAIKILKGKLYQLELEKKKEELDNLKSNNVSNSFGSQIRSYVMHPYSMVKDHRTSIETGNVSKVMDGDINLFINGYLKMAARGEI
jgi:peptide chain release factor 2